MDTSFDALVEWACGHPPYDYQRRLAQEGLPELLRVPTGGRDPRRAPAVAAPLAVPS